MRGLRKSFGTLDILKGIDLDVAQGEKIALIGPSGSGKSHLPALRQFSRTAQGHAQEADTEVFDHR